MKEFYRKLSPDLAFILAVILGLLVIRPCNAATSLSSPSSSYSAYIGQSVTLTCNGINMNENDFVWEYIDTTNARIRIYFENVLDITTGKYIVDTVQYAFGNVSSTMVITNVNSVDGTYKYTCVCNTFKTCSGTNTASATMTLISLGKYIA